MNLQTFMKWLTCSLFLSCIAIVAYAFMFYEPARLSALVLEKSATFSAIPWVTIEQPAVENGATIPADTNVIFFLPDDILPIEREVLLGWQGKETRYWGYCFPANYDPALASKTYGFPGKLFLSEKERKVRKQLVEEKKPTYSILRPPTRGDIRARNEVEVFNTIIRHQLEIFPAGSICYIMTEKPLPIGTDRDDDLLNTNLERFRRTESNKPDTDGDGISDGLESQFLHSDPKERDTDGDGIIDGLEDANHNGKIERNETDPTDMDTDRDNLCDGLCNVGKKRPVCPTSVGKPTCIQSTMRGEDKNINGLVDLGETDPRKEDTDGDGILDEQEFFNCVLLNKDPSKC